MLDGKHLEVIRYCLIQRTVPFLYYIHNKGILSALQYFQLKGIPKYEERTGTASGTK